MTDDDAGTFWCPSCGAEMYADAPRCPKCGDYVTPGARRMPRWIWIAAIVVILALVAGALRSFR